jgi:hypothetical protein
MALLGSQTLACNDLVTSFSRHKLFPHLKPLVRLGMVVYACNLSTPETEEGTSRVQNRLVYTASLRSATYSWALVTHTCNPSYSGGRDQEDQGLKSANNSRDPISKKKTITKKGWWSGSRYSPWVQTPVCKKKKKENVQHETGLASSSSACLASLPWGILLFLPHRAEGRITMNVLLPSCCIWPYFFFFFFSWGTGVWIQCLHLEPITSPFLWRVFQDWVLQTICPGWLLITILLISASWVARITGVRPWHPTFFKK